MIKVKAISEHGCTASESAVVTLTICTLTVCQHVATDSCQGLLILICVLVSEPVCRVTAHMVVKAIPISSGCKAHSTRAPVVLGTPLAPWTVRHGVVLEECLARSDPARLRVVDERRHVAQASDSQSSFTWERPHH